MISVNNIKKEFGGSVLFSGITFSLNKRERVGLAGKNGTGKTTLLRIISGQVEQDGGEVILSDGDRLGYLPQEMKIKSDRSVLDEALKAYYFLDELKEKEQELNQSLIHRTDYQSNSYSILLIELENIHQQLNLYEPEKLRGLAEQVLTGLGFRRTDFDKPLKTFSYGWQMRVELAKLLMIKPDLLLLDEPTNHLDIESIQWLEDFLIGFPGSLIIVSHDRTLLDNITNRTIEINNGRMIDYKVSYSQYIQLREERILHQQAAFANQQKQIREIEQFIERFRYKATKARQVQSRIKQMEKMDRVAVDDLDKALIRFSFPPAPHSGKVTVEGENIKKKYGEKLVFGQINIQILRGEKVAFVGRNGEGKTTLAKIIAGQLDFQGQLKMGHQVITGFFAQEQKEMLDLEKSVFETLDDVAVGEIRTRLKSILGAFLFRGEDIDKKVKVLSGGEKSRLSLAKLLLQPTNFLILDEPTNHLDILSKDILKNALLQYDGTLIIVSHDRDFLQGLTSKVFEFRDGKVNEHLGDVFEYLEKRRLANLKELEIKESEGNKVGDNISANKAKWEQKKIQEKEKRKLMNDIQKAEALITRLEGEIEELNKRLAKPEKFADEIKSGGIYKEHDRLSSYLSKTFSEWETLQLKLEAY
ncbi:MAG: ABC-F family ATP-binding cassette domain-containing protein [Bacteroidales bacterium]|nr:ABC-F family ATP-binding cassette domain-containing protein [Bacteroidales bacterium]